MLMAITNRGIDRKAQDVQGCSRVCTGGFSIDLETSSQVVLLLAHGQLLHNEALKRSSRAAATSPTCAVVDIEPPVVLRQLCFRVLQVRQDASLKRQM